MKRVMIVLACVAALGATATTAVRAAEPVPVVTTMKSAPETARASALAAQENAYAQREANGSDLESFRGGASEEVVIAAVVVAVVLLLLL